MFKVLIVEDDPMVAMINEQYVLKNKGYSIAHSCSNGQEAISYLQENSVDLVVLDVFMPIMDGIETLKKIREQKFPVEVIMVTAANDTSTLEETMHLGVLDYLIKPFAFERFQVALEKFSAKISTLKQSSTISQDLIDSLISTNPDTTSLAAKTPKGIQPKTMNLILDYFEQNPGWHSGDQLAQNLGLSTVTIRHYLNYLAQQHIIIQDINYSTGGRPSMLYKK